MRTIALVMTRVDVHRNQGFGFINDEVSARLERNLPRKGRVDLALKSVMFEDAHATIVAANLGFRTARNTACHIAHCLVAFLIVDDDCIHVFGEPIAHDALAEVRLLEDATGRAQVLRVCLHFIPDREQVAKVTCKRFRARALTGRTHDKTNVIRKRQAVKNCFQAAAFGCVANLLGNAANMCAGHHHEVSTRDGQVRRHARALRRNWTLRHLNNDFGSRRKEFGNFLIRKTRRFTSIATRGRIPTIIFIKN